MQLSWRLARLTAGAMLAITAVVSVTSTPVEAQKKEKDKNEERPKQQDPVEWSDPVLQGKVEKMYYVEGKDSTPAKKIWIPTMEFFSKESDVWATVYVDHPDAQQVARTQGCPGRFVVAIGHRIDEKTLSAEGLQWLDPEAQCTGEFGPPPS